MTPFEEFKFWLRQGAPWERAMVSLSAAIVLGLIAWVVVPVRGNDASEVANDTVVSGQPVGDNAAGTPVAGGSESNLPASTSNGSLRGGSTSSGGAPAPGSTSGQASTGDSPDCPSGSTDQGVTETTINVAVILLDIAGGNSIVGVPSVDEQRRQNEAMINYYNSNGGIRCRKLAAKFYIDNPFDPNSERSVCLDIVASKTFATIGALYQAQNSTCLAQAKIPSYAQTVKATSEVKKFSPYIFTPYVDSETNMAIYVAGAKEQGFFNGMTKLGVILAQCFPEYNDQLLGALSNAGIAKDKIVTFDYGCPPGRIIAPPSTVAQAVLRFQQAGVNRVMTSGSNIASFTRQAQSQGYKPQYATTDLDTTMQLSQGAGFAPDPENFDGSLNIANNQYGATTTPGTPITAFTKQCDAALTKGGAQKTTDEIGYAGGTCNQWNMFFLGATKAPSLQRTQLAVGLNSVGRFDQSYPMAPALWNDPTKTWAGPYWRPIRYVGSCNCWKVVRAEFSDATAATG